MTDGVWFPCFWTWEVCDSLVSNNMCWRFCWVTPGLAYRHQCGSILFTEIGITGALSQPARSLIEGCHAVRKPSHTGRLQEGAWVGNNSLQVLLSKCQICEWTSSQMTVAPSCWVNPRHGGGEAQASHPHCSPSEFLPQSTQTNVLHCTSVFEGMFIM